MHNRIPFGGNVIGINGGFSGTPPVRDGFSLDASSRMTQQMMQMIQIFMTLTTQMLSLTMSQNGGGLGPPGLSSFGSDSSGIPESPGLRNFLGQAGGGVTQKTAGGQDQVKVGEKTGSLVDLGGGKKVDSSIAGNVKQMIADAKKEGVDLKITSAFRSREQQEVLYAKYKNGTGNLAAKPGSSNHESGRAIDFSNTTGAYAWLKKNAGRYGLKNLPSEPWHYSTNGR